MPRLNYSLATTGGGMGAIWSAMRRSVAGQPDMPNRVQMSSYAGPTRQISTTNLAAISAAIEAGFCLQLCNQVALDFLNARGEEEKQKRRKHNMNMKKRNKIMRLLNI
jgi:hypothetical protein